MGPKELAYTRPRSGVSLYNFKRSREFYPDGHGERNIPLLVCLVGIMASRDLLQSKNAQRDLPQRRAPLALPSMAEHDFQ